ncbi:MAG TPA: hypothetical protein VJ738_11450 [Steroidobacteraceae bacterium]|nr:hypothetical protein [Steroidobacteraceae bacterium]
MSTRQIMAMPVRREVRIYTDGDRPTPAYNPPVFLARHLRRWHIFNVNRLIPDQVFNKKTVAATNVRPGVQARASHGGV